MVLQVVAVNAAMASLTKTLSVFPVERSIVGRERAKGAYGVAPYFLAKLAAELPIGALFPLLFGSLVYPAAGLNKLPSRYHLPWHELRAPCALQIGTGHLAGDCLSVLHQ